MVMCIDALYAWGSICPTTGWMWGCGAAAAVTLVRLPDININRSHIFSNRIPYVCKQHYDFCLGSGFLGELDEDLTLISLQ